MEIIKIYQNKHEGEQAQQHLKKNENGISECHERIIAHYQTLSDNNSSLSDITWGEMLTIAKIQARFWKELLRKTIFKDSFSSM